MRRIYIGKIRAFLPSWGCRTKISEKTYTNLIASIWVLATLSLVLDIVASVGYAHDHKIFPDPLTTPTPSTTPGGRPIIGPIGPIGPPDNSGSGASGDGSGGSGSGDGNDARKYVVLGKVIYKVTSPSGTGIALGLFGFIVAGFGSSILTGTSNEHNTVVRDSLLIILALMLTIFSFVTLVFQIFSLAYKLTQDDIQLENDVSAIWIVQILCVAFLFMVTLITTCATSCCKWNTASMETINNAITKELLETSDHMSVPRSSISLVA